MNSNKNYKPGSERVRGGEFAAEDCWLDGYHDEDIDDRTSYCDFFGDVAPEVSWGDPPTE